MIAAVSLPRSNGAISHKLPGPNVEVEQHFPVSGAGPHASAPYAP